MTVLDVTGAAGPEQGSAFLDTDALFASYDNGAVFDYGGVNYHRMEEMLNRDGKARSLEQCLSLPVRKAPVAIHRGQATPEVTKFVEQALFSPANNGGMTTPMNLVISQMTSAFVHKKAFFEKVLTTDPEGRTVYEKVAFRPSPTCYVVRDPKTGSFKGFRQMPVRMEHTNDEPAELEFKPDRAFVYIHGTHRNPLNGISDMEVAHWCYMTKNKIKYLWFNFLEGQALPKTIVKGQTQQEADRAAKKILALRGGGVVGMTDSVEIDKHESAGEGAGQFLEALKWLDSEASGSVLAGFTDHAAQGGSSFALSKNETDFFLMAHQSKSTEMADHMNQYLIPDLVRYNFGPTAASPVLKFAPIAEDDAAAAIAFLQSMAGAQNHGLPKAFMDELVERVAGFLDLNTAKVREGLEKAAREAEEAARNNPNPEAPVVAGVAGAVSAADRAVTRRLRAVPEGEPRRPHPGDATDAFRKR